MQLETSHGQHEGVGAQGVSQAEHVSAGIIMYMAAWVLLYFPVCKALEEIVALRNITLCNNFCRSLQEGKGLQDLHLPPERGAENDFIRLKRNMFWMGRSLLDREHRIAGMLSELEEAQRQVMDSIEYASAIQHQMQIPAARLTDYVVDGYILWKPRDVVGGDSYWLRRTPGGVFVGVFDCTGHGVPGAFITLIVHSMLDNMDLTTMEGHPGRVLESLNRKLKAFLGQNGEATGTGKRSNDGLEMGLCWLPNDTATMCYAGAGISAFLVADGETRELKAERVGIGYREAPQDHAYAEQCLSLEGIAGVHLATDGLFDQVGGEKNLPFGKRRFLKLIAEYGGHPFSAQQAGIWELFESHRGLSARRDDVTVLGFAPGRVARERA
ncbi:SpoIIE family protein phosphatase [Megalodesulfovibrio paquesii]